LAREARRNAIVLKAVMEKCTPLLHRYRFFMDLTPHFDGRRWSRFQRLCAVIVAAYISIYEQAEKTQALFDHRTSYLRKKNEKYQDRRTVHRGPDLPDHPLSCASRCPAGATST
jgi:hypothetical protein